MRRILGNIGCFRLPDGRYGFGRIFDDACVAFYKHIGISEKDAPTTEDYACIVGLYNSSVTKMKMVEKRPYESINEVTPPPMAIKDLISGKYRIYKNVNIFPSTYEECKNLEICAVWELEHVIDRLMGDNKWNMK